jgi:hypothetical protein
LNKPTTFEQIGLSRFKMDLSKQAEKELWDFLIDMDQLPYNQEAFAANVNLEIKRQIESIDKSIVWLLDRASGFRQDKYLLIVNSEEDADKIRDTTLEFNARKGKPFEIKLEERTSQRDRDDAKWRGVWVHIFGTYGHSFDKRTHEVALNKEPVENFDTLLRDFAQDEARPKQDPGNPIMDSDSPLKTVVGKWCSFPEI